MKQVCILVMAALSAVAAAQSVMVVGTISNKDNGQIVFTTIKGKCEGDQHLVYSTGNGGEIGIYGCYSHANGQLLVLWGDGSMFSYPLERLEFSADAERVLREK